MIEISVSDVRLALAAAAAGEHRGAGAAATPLLGTIFHATFADLVSADAEVSGIGLILLSGPTRQRRVEAVLEHTWRRLVAPRLLRHAAELQTTSEAVLVLWRAAERLVEWLTDVVVEVAQQTDRCEAGAGLNVPLIAQQIVAEVPLSCDLREPTWGERVRLTGFADSILRVPGRGGVCAIELKLGKAAPPVDLGQAALYRLILVRSGVQAADAALAMLRFSPDLEELVVDGARLAHAEAALLDLIARIANVPRIAPQVEPVGRTPTPPAVGHRPPFKAPPTPSFDWPMAAGLPAESRSPVAPAVGGDAPQGASANGSSGDEGLGRNLVRACREHGVGIDLRGDPTRGPRFLRFNVRLTGGSRLTALERIMPEVALRLNREHQPMVTSEAGALFVDVARTDPQAVPFESIAAQIPPIDPIIGSGRLPIGVDAGGRLHLADLASAARAHALVAGSTGSGKSEWLRAAVAGLIASNTPDTLRFVTIDPKLNAFADLEKSRFLWTRDSWWIPGCGREATEVFEDLVAEMDRRYQLTRTSGTDNLTDHVRKTGRPLPRIVCVCDEYMALVTNRAAKGQIEEAVTLLGAKARAAGIHLILATQQPSRAVISGAIQANLPVRVALSLTSPIESNMILGRAGAERLTGKGDLLYRDFGNPVRLQAPLLGAEERKRTFAG